MLLPNDFDFDSANVKDRIPIKPDLIGILTAKSEFIKDMEIYKRRMEVRLAKGSIDFENTSFSFLDNSIGDAQVSEHMLSRNDDERTDSQSQNDFQSQSDPPSQSDNRQNNPFADELISGAIGISDEDDCDYFKVENECLNDKRFNNLLSILTKHSKHLKEISSNQEKMWKEMRKMRKKQTCR